MANNSIVSVRETSLVDIQCLLQKALNETFGNPREFEESDPEKTKRLFKEQRQKLENRLQCSPGAAKKLFADDSQSSVKDFAAALHVLGYKLKLDIEKEE